jgi:glycerol-3-phosphate dehydrogenase subunit C
MQCDPVSASDSREGSLEAPTRHPIDWRSADFRDEKLLLQELERIFDICHGCRRCFSLCNAFPTLFDAIDASPSGEVEGVDQKVYWDVVDHCYLCDMCYMTKCPYVPPHPWNVDFPHLMLRAKAFKFTHQPVRKRDRILSATDTVGMLAGIPVVAEIVNAVNKTATGRKLLDKALGVHPQAPVPEYHSKSYRKQHAAAAHPAIDVQPTADTKGRVVLFATCYGNRNEPDLGKDLTAIFEHNGIAVTIAGSEHCCGMPKLEIGDLESVARLKERNIPELARLVDEGWDIVTPVPSCTLMFKQELPLMFPDDPQVLKVRDEISLGALQGRAAADQLHAQARQDQLSRAVSSARAEPRTENPRRADAGAADAGRADRALLRSQRHLRREERISRCVDEDRPSRHTPRRRQRRGLLFQRLPDGRSPDRVGND